MPKRKAKPTPVEVAYGDVGKECQRFVLELRPADVRACKHLSVDLCRDLQLSVSWQDCVRAFLSYVGQTKQLPPDIFPEGKRTKAGDA
jgi:hypothetical protein